MRVSWLAPDTGSDSDPHGHEVRFLRLMQVHSDWLSGIYPLPSLVAAPADPTEMFPGAGNRVSTPVFAVTGIISRPFPNGSLATLCLIGQSVTLPLVQLQEQHLEVQLRPIFTRFLLQFQNASPMGE